MWKKTYKLWIKNKNLPIDLKNEILKMSKAELKEAFSSDLEFGTAGIRAKIAPGSANFNSVNIKRFAMAFAEFLTDNFSKDDLRTKGVLIGHDNRKYSEKLSLEIISVFNEYEIRSIIFPANKPIPNPFMSYGIKKIKTVAGISLTASHNEKNYNGIKIYNSKGCEYLPKYTDIILDLYDSINVTDAINFDVGIVHSNLVEKVSNKLEENYIKDVLKIQFHPRVKRNIKIVFSNLHGTCQRITPIVFKKSGYKCFCLKEQFELDSNFKNCPNPNPELEENYLLATKYAKKITADLIILNDPDGDRIGVSVLHKNKYYIIHANELTPILLKYIVEQYKNKKLIKNSVVYGSIVSSNLFEKVANAYNIKVKKTLTGFKWISNAIAKNESKKVLFGFEESNSFIFSNVINEKDGIQSSLLVAEAVDYYKKRKKTLVSVLYEIYRKFGYFYCQTISKYFEPKNKELYINDIMDTLRYNRIDTLGGLKIVKKDDYINNFDGLQEENLIKFWLEDGSWFAVRPSGTEPKIKFYFVFINNDNLKAAKKQMKAVKRELFDYLKI